MVLMICDARCPLLHFSGALAEYAGARLGRRLLLVLNKCDLVPPAAVQAWTQFFQQRYPGIAVVPAASNGGPEAAVHSARSILSAVLACKVQRGGQQVGAADLVASSVDEVLQESAVRNTHSKRAPPDAAAGSLPGSGRSSWATQAGGDDIGSASEGAGPELPSLSLAAGDASDSGSGSDWDVRGTKAKRKVAGRRRKGGGGGAVAGAGAGQQQGSRGGKQGVQAAGGAGRAAEQAKASGGGADGGAGVSGPSRAGSALAAEEQALQALMQREEFDAVAGAAAGAGLSPLVVAVVGEPNVGKSSTLNALLGGHRVAVSSHPGRTRHFQTHYMTPRLVLCDCPGLVFPRLDVALPLQVLYGSFPIARCQEPYSVVRWGPLLLCCTCCYLCLRGT